MPEIQKKKIPAWYLFFVQRFNEFNDKKNGEEIKEHLTFLYGYIIGLNHANVLKGKESENLGELITAQALWKAQQLHEREKTYYSAEDYQKDLEAELPF